MARSFTRPMNSRATPNSTSASSKASRMSRSVRNVLFRNLAQAPQLPERVIQFIS